MTRRFYLRPVISLATQRNRLDPNGAAPYRLCGRHDIAFTHVELIDRAEKGEGRCRLVGGFDAQDWYHPPFDGGQMWATFETIVRARAPISGFSMERPRIMAIVNVTPDSFSDGGQHANTKAAVLCGIGRTANANGSPLRPRSWIAGSSSSSSPSSST